MRTGTDGAALRGLATLWSAGATSGLTDGQLLERFATGSGEAAELAFEALVERHGPMVQRVCRAHLADPHDAHDAFQATFLVLVRKARGLWVRDSLGPWLHQVARRSALRARSNAARRRTIEQKVAETSPEARDPQPRPEFDLEEALHEEINRLPDRLRAPIVLCDLQGLSCEEAARRMNRPVGTVKSWRSRARDRLRSRLTRRGLAPSASLFAPLGASLGSIPEWTAAGEVSASALKVAQGVLKTMFLTKLKTAAAALAVIFLAGGAGAVAWTIADDPPKPKPQAAAVAEPAKKEDDAATWPLTLQEAVRIGLANADFVRVVSEPGEKGLFKIAPRDEFEASEFKNKVTELAILIEVWYWGLNRRLASAAPAENALEMVRAVYKREEAKLNAGKSDGQAAYRVWRQLRKLEDGAKGSGAGSIYEHQLRKALSLPENDGRRIVPVTPPAEATREWDWRAWRADEAKNPGAFNRSRLETITRGLDRTFAMLRKAPRERRVATEKLAEERRRYASGEVPPDDYLKAISEFAQSIYTELENKREYNIWIAEYDDATGKLLDRDQIEIVDAPAAQPEPTPAPARVQSEPKRDRGAEKAAGQTYSFNLSIDLGGKPIEIPGSLTVAPAP